MSKRLKFFNNKTKTLKKSNINFSFLFIYKQLLRSFYGFFSEKQFQSLLLFSLSFLGRRSLSDCFVSCLESRLDILLFRSQLVRSVQEGQNLISNGLVFLLKKSLYSSDRFYFKKQKIKSLLLMPGDIVWLNLNKQSNFCLLEKKNFVSYLEVFFELNMFIFLYRPFLFEIYLPFVYNIYLRNNLNLNYYFSFSWFDLISVEVLSFENNFFYFKSDVNFLVIDELFEIIFLFYGKKKLL